jgi:hypothetical protein
MCVGVCSSVELQSQRCGLGAQGQWQALYSPVKVYSVRRHTIV